MTSCERQRHTAVRRLDELGRGQRVAPTAERSPKSSPRRGAEPGALYVHAQPVDLDAVGAEAVAGLGYANHQVDLRLADTLPPVLADAALLERVLANLIDNAVHHSPPDTPCEVHAVTAGHRLDVRVVDHGPGIPVDQRSTVFEPFQRLDDHTGGIGLGLAVARGLAEAVSADLTIEDTPGGGATMILGLKVGS